MECWASCRRRRRPEDRPNAEQQQKCPHFVDTLRHTEMPDEMKNYDWHGIFEVISVSAFIANNVFPFCRLLDCTCFTAFFVVLFRRRFLKLHKAISVYARMRDQTASHTKQKENVRNANKMEHVTERVKLFHLFYFVLRHLIASASWAFAIQVKLFPCFSRRLHFSSRPCAGTLGKCARPSSVFFFVSRKIRIK